MTSAGRSTSSNEEAAMSGERRPYRGVSNTLPNNGAGPWKNKPCPDCDGYEDAHTATCPSVEGRVSSPAELRALADEIESRDCTGMVAVWCPVHGDCRGCTRHDDGEWDEFHPACPLHGTRTAHAAGALS